MTKTSKRLLSLLLAFVLAIAALPYLGLGAGKDSTVHAANFIPEDIGLTGGMFQTSSTSYPVNPDGFSGGKMDGSNTGAIFAAGIVDLEPEAFNKAINASGEDKLRLKDRNYTYRGGESTPATPFGYGDKVSVGTKALMINSPVDATFYAFKSNALTLSPSRYYEFSASVMTGSFKLGGAYIKVVSSNPEDNIDLSFGPIDTSGQTASLGWKQYRFFIETSSFASASVEFSLQIGDYVDTTDIHGNKKISSDTACGVAFFDNVTAKLVSKDYYDLALASYGMGKHDDVYVHTAKTSVQYDPTESDFIAGSNYDKAFADRSFEGSLDGNGEIVNSAVYTHINTINIDSFESYQTSYGLGDNPESPFGSRNVLMLSNRIESYSGYRTQNFLIERHRFYRLSVWYRAGENTTAAIARVSHMYDDKGTATPFDDLYKTFDVSCSAGGDTYTNGWTEAVFYITGSPLEDKYVRLELLLGDANTGARGSVFFDDINLEVLLPKAFNANYSNGTAVNFDAVDFAAGSNPSVPNGFFNNVAEYTKYEYPLKAAEFNGYFAGNSNLSRAGNKERNDEGIISGIIPCDDTHFNNNKSNYGTGAVNPYANLGMRKNVLMLYSPRPTAYAFVTPDITSSADTYTRIDVALSTNITSGDGANLVLKMGSTVIAEIKDIKNNFEPTPYSFIIQNGKVDQNLRVEIWLGKSDNANNDTKLSSGHLYVSYVTKSDEATIDDYNAALNNSRMARFSFKTDKFEAYDTDSTHAYLYTPYTWQFVTNTNRNTTGHLANAGVLRANMLDTDTDLVQTIGFTHSDQLSPNILMIRSNAATAVYLKSILTYPLNEAETTYYRIMVRIKTIGIPTDNADLGATIKLTGGASGEFTAINTERNLGENQRNDYQEYYFYVQTQDNSTEVGFEFWLGNDQRTSYFTSGNVFIESFDISGISEIDFKESLELYEEELDYDDEDKTVFNILKIVVGETPSTDDDDSGSTYSPSDFPWWGIPTILMVLALLIAVLGTLYKNHGAAIIARLRARRATVSYDRDKVIEPIHARNIDRIRREKLEQLSGSDDEFGDEESTEEGDEQDQQETLSQPEPAQAETQTSDEDEDLKQFEE